MATETEVSVVIREASLDDICQLQSLYKQQYPLEIQQKHKSISKYIKKSFKTDLNDINKYYLYPDRHGLFVANAMNDTNNSNEIIGMIGIRENKSFNINKFNILKDKVEIKQMDIDTDGDRKPDFEYAYQCIDDVIDIFTSINNGKFIKSNSKQKNVIKHCKEAEIMRFGVSKNYRRRGIGKALFNHIKQFCIDNGYEFIVASTMNVLHDAIQFYKSTGFQLIETESCGPDTKLQFLRFVYNLDQTKTL